MDNKKFFGKIRSKLFNGTLKQSQVDGLTTLLTAIKDAGISDARWVAYVLATAYYETGKSIQPIEDYGKGKGYHYSKKLKRSRNHMPTG